MVPSRLGVGIVCVALLGLCGCAKDAPVEVQPQSGLERAKGILNDYASGVPLGSEAATYEEIVAEVRQTDQQKAAILEKGFADLKRSKQNLRQNCARRQKIFRSRHQPFPRGKAEPPPFTVSQ